MSQTPDHSESHLQQNTIALLKAMGWQFISREEIHNHRENTNKVVLKDILLERLQAFNSFEYKNNNYKFSAKNIAKAIKNLDVPLNEGLGIANQKITDKLLLGGAYEEVLSDGVRKSFTINYIDFANVENNVFHFTEEFVVNRIVKNKMAKTRRPDLVLFINGIVVGVIELKKSSIDTAQGISQMIRNQKEQEIPQLFKYAQITLAGNSHTPKYATVKTSKKFYSLWQEEIDFSELIENRTPSNLDKTLVALFTKNRIIDLIHSFILFDGLNKKIVRYQQFFAIQSALNKIETLDKTGRRAGGLIWHTQGSGKSLTMVMLAKEIKRLVVNAKIIIVTDRKDLDKQIHDTFRSSEIPAEKATSGKNLIGLLQSGTSVITTVINKFETVKNEQIKLDNDNIFVLVDESHRSQSGDMNRVMNNVLTKACYIGFTGTPLMKKEKNSFVKFGGEIHRYTIKQAVKDKAILPLLYEGRFVDQWIADNKSMDKRFDKISHNLSEEQKLDLKKKWARFQRVAGSERRLEMIADDVHRHFQQEIKGTGLKAMLATSSKYEAIKYHQLFTEYNDLKTAFVISKPDNKEGDETVDEEEDSKIFVSDNWSKLMRKYGDEDQFLSKVTDEFVNGEEIDLLIVVDKLLTGFDAPKATYLYIDKALKEHNLLQAIARVNRLYEGKDFGFILDYRGLLGDLDKALTDYSGLNGFDEDDIYSVVFDIKDEINMVKTYFTNLGELFAEIDGKTDQESYEVYLADKEKRKIFYGFLSQYARSLKIALSSDKLDAIFNDDEIKEFKRKMRFYAELRSAIKIRYFEAVDFAQYEKQMQKLLNTFISADEVNQLTRTVNIFDDGFDEEVKRLRGSNARADAILSASSAYISEKMDSNPAYYEKLSRKIDKIIDDYRNKRLDEEEKLANAKQVQQILANAGNEDQNKGYPKAIKNNSFAKIIYDNIGDDFAELSDDIQANFSLNVERICQEFSKRPDWQNSTDIKNKTNGKIQDLLWQLEDKFEPTFKVGEILEKLRSIWLNN